MKLSHKQKDSLYEVIHNKIIDLRIELSKKNHNDDYDSALSKVVGKIYDEILTKLNIK